MHNAGAAAVSPPSASSHYRSMLSTEDQTSSNHPSTENEGRPSSPSSSSFLPSTSTAVDPSTSSSSSQTGSAPHSSSLSESKAASASSATSLPDPAQSDHTTTTSISDGDINAALTGAASSSLSASTPPPVPTPSAMASTPGPVAGLVSASSSSSPSSSTSLRGVFVGSKVVVHFRATGSAPILRRSKFTLSAQHRFHTVTQWLRRTLQLKENEALFIFCNQAFSPQQDATVGDLAQCFAIQGELVLNYAMQDAWG